MTLGNGWDNVDEIACFHAIYDSIHYQKHMDASNDHAYAITEGSPDLLCGKCSNFLLEHSVALEEEGHDLCNINDLTGDGKFGQGVDVVAKKDISCRSVLTNPFVNEYLWMAVDHSLLQHTEVG